MNKRVLVTAHGKVQNVGFRYFTHNTANALGLSGYVKNQIDGSVYIEAEGPEELLEEFVYLVKQGPRWANVSRVDLQEAPVDNMKGFVIR